MTQFVEPTPTPESVWRAIILFGKNTATYKFALGRAILALGKEPGSEIALDELALPYARELARHLALADKQITGPKSQFLEACRGFNAGEVSDEALRSVTVQLGFNNVLDAFHVVNQGETPIRFFDVTGSGRSKGIVLTDALFALRQGVQGDNLPHEVEARWRLVETAWALKLSKNLIQVDVVDAGTQLVVARKGLQRVAVTSSRAALNGYQKGKFFLL